MAILLQAGQRPTAGYGVDVMAAVKTGLFMTIRWRERVPARDAMVAQVLTSPWLIQKLVRVDIPVIFIKDSEAVLALPRSEYFAFKAAFPRCAAGLEGTLPPGTRTTLFILPGGVMAPFLKENAACAK